MKAAFHWQKRTVCCRNNKRLKLYIVLTNKSKKGEMKL